MPKPEREDEFPVVAFDIETRSLGGEAIYVTWCDGGEPHGQVLKGDNALTDWFIKTILVPEFDKHIIVAHFGLRFDYLRLRWNILARAKHKGVFFAAKSLNNIRGINLRRSIYHWLLRDSFNYFPGSLDEFCKTFAPEFKKGHIDFSKEKFDPRKRRHVNYALNDSRILWHAVKNYNATMLEAFNVSIFDAITVPGLALKCIKRMSANNGYPKPDLLPEKFEEAVRSSYHGGLTCAFKVGTFTNVLYYDIRSAYAKIMRDFAFPSGQVIWTFNRPATQDCLVFATVHIGDEFPFIVSRGTVKGEAVHKARFKGTVTGWFWEFELDIQSRLGSAVKRWCWLIFTERDDRHRDFIQTCQRFRDRDYKGPIGMLAKLMQNSGGYGKYGSEPLMHEVKLGMDKPNGIACPAMLDDGTDIEGLWIVSKIRRQWTLVHWASYITARARCMLMEYLMRIPEKEWIYSDTDSFIVPDKYESIFKSDVGDDYGQLKLEYHIAPRQKFKSIEINAPKTYRIRKHQPGAKDVYHAKGMPARSVAAAFSKGKVTFDASRSLGVVMRGKFKKGERYRHTVKRTLSNPYSVAHGKFIKGVWTADTVSDTFIPAVELLEPIIGQIKKVLK